MDVKALIITDPETNTEHELLLSKEDYERAMKDEQFVNSLLFHARVMAKSNCSTNPSFEIIDQRLLHDESENNNVNCSETAPTINWNYNQTVCLINSMAVHFSDFNDPRKRKAVFENVSNDLISSGFTVNSIQAQNKWKSLMRSYHKAKDSKNRTGQGPPRFLFFELIDDILGDKPSNKCSHSLNSLEVVENRNENEQEALPESEVQESQVETSESENNIEANKENRKRKRTSEKFCRKDYVQLKTEEYKKRQIRHEEKMTLEREKLEIERRKVDILDAYIALKKCD